MPHRRVVAPIATVEPPDLPARTGGPGGGAPVASHLVTSAARRRRVLSALVGATVALAIGGVAVTSLRWAALCAAALTAGYLVAVARARHRAVQREMARAFGGPGGGFDWAALREPGGAGAPAGHAIGSLSDDELAAAVSGAGPFAVVRFAVAYLLGWLLTPVAIVIHLVAGDHRDLEGDGALAWIVALQRRGRAHSFRALAVSLATTAGVTAVGGLTGLAAAPAASAAPAPATYTVRVGDTLGSIAAAHGTTVQALAAANHLADPNLIFPGQVLTLGPASAYAGSSYTGSSYTGSSYTGSIYTVQQGDTLGSIAARYGIAWQALASANQLSDPDFITVGEVLRIDGAVSRTAATTSPTSPGGTYTVQAGDTLAAIAARWGTTWEALAAANHLSDPNLLSVGEVLSLRGAPSSSAAPVSAAPASTTPASTTPASASPASAAPAPASSLGARALAVALAQVGKPYEWGGAGPSSFDCSGLVMYAYDAVGVHLAHYTVSQYQETARISESQLAPGDLVFWGGSAPYHVALYAGDGTIVVADQTGTPVRVEPMTWDGTPSGFGRVG